MADSRIEPQAVVAAVEDYVTTELNDAARYENRQPLDESGVYSLHVLAARVYALGWDDAERAVVERERRRRNRDRDVG